MFLAHYQRSAAACQDVPLPLLVKAMGETNFALMAYITNKHGQMVYMSFELSKWPQQI